HGPAHRTLGAAAPAGAQGDTRRPAQGVRSGVGMAARNLLLALALAALACGSRPPEPRRSDEGRLGSVRSFGPGPDPGPLVVLFSDLKGFSPALEAAARGIAESGAVVVGVDLPDYLARLRASDDGCHYLISEIEDLAHRYERERGFESYRSPVLAGFGQGGALAYAALAQSPAATVAGAVSVDPAPFVGTRVPLCEGAPASAVPGGFRYGAASHLPGFWTVDSLTPLPPELAALAGPAPEEEDDSERAATPGDPAGRLLAAVN